MLATQQAHDRRQSKNLGMSRRFVMRVGLAALVAASSLYLFPGDLVGQQDTGGGLGHNIQTFRAVGGKVVTIKGDPVSGAMVEIENDFGGQFRVVSTDRNGEFHSEYVLANLQSPHFSFTLTVSKKGFRKAHRIASNQGSNANVGAFITLRTPQEDPTLLSEADMVNGVAPKLRHLSPSDGLSAKEEKDYARGVEEFLDRNRVDRAVPLFDKVVEHDPSCLRCRTMLGLAELNWGDWDDATADLGGAVNAMIADKSLGRAEPLLAYGVLASWEHEPTKASAYFMEALKYAPYDALALQELGRAQCLNADWEDANETLKKAVAAGAGPEARLLHTEALLWAGTAQEASDELDRYLNGRDIKKLPIRVRLLSDRVEEKKKDAAAFAAANAKLRARGEQPLDYINHPPKDLANFEPASDQSQLVPILDAVGQKVAELYKNLPNTISIEEIHQERLNRAGKPEARLDQKFRYLCLMPILPTGPATDEYRTDSRGIPAVPRGLREDLMLTAGFVSAPLLFHPAYQNGSIFRYLGRQKTKGSTTHVIAFAQQPAKARIYGSFKDGKRSKLTYVQGMAWVDDATHQIVHLRTDLLNPLPQVKLDKETTEINFNEVQFKTVPQRFWLPDEVVVTLNWAGRVLRNKHEYSDFLVFNVEERQKISLPQRR
jgi:Tfp pilus assembly protein PilF